MRYNPMRRLWLALRIAAAQGDMEAVQLALGAIRHQKHEQRRQRERSQAA